jgi:hypothetical protein
MELTNFIRQLVNEGTVPVQDLIADFPEADEVETSKLLHKFYQEDILEMPLKAPGFDEAAALWATKYFYTAVQLTVLRDVEETAIHEKLKPYEGDISAAAMYSADLVFRHLPSLLRLAKGLAPADVLVTAIIKTLENWPYSAAGVQLEEIKNEAIIFSDASLKISYLDRLIQAGDRSKIENAGLQEAIFSVAGAHLDTIWPKSGLTLITDKHIE